MDSNISKDLTLEEMESLFRSYDLINIRYYQVSNPKTFNPDDKRIYNWHITVRHEENVPVKEIFSCAVKEVRKRLALQNKVSPLVEALLKAKQAACEKADTPDGGTCNFDSVLIRLDGWTKEELNEAVKLSGVPFSKKITSGFYKGYYFVHTPKQGQANCRTTMAEAAERVLKNYGFRTNMYYQVD